MFCCLPSEQTGHWWQLFLGIFPFEYQTGGHSTKNRNVSHWLGKLNNECLLYCLHHEEVVLEAQLLQAVVVEEGGEALPFPRAAAVVVEGEVPAFSRFNIPDVLRNTFRGEEES